MPNIGGVKHLMEDIDSTLSMSEVHDEIMRREFKALRETSVSYMVEKIMNFYRNADGSESFDEELEKLADRNPLNFLAAMEICNLKNMIKPKC